MARLGLVGALAVALLVQSACSEGSSPTDAGNQTPPDAGAVSKDAGSGSTTDAGLKTFTINATSVRLAQHPTNGDSQANGAIGVLRNGVFVDTATVTVNGVSIPLHSTLVGGFYDMSKANLPSLPPGSGSTVEIVAVDGADRAEVVLTCPTAVTFTSPAAGSALPVGDFTASWTGKLDYNAGGTKSSVRLFPYNPSTSTSGQFVDETNTSKYLEGNATSAQLHNPGGSLPGYLLEMQVEGVAVNGADGLGKCTTQFRIALSKP